MLYEPYTDELAQIGSLHRRLTEAYDQQYFIWDTTREIVYRTRAELPEHWYVLMDNIRMDICQRLAQLTALGIPECEHDFQPNVAGHWICTKCHRFSALATAADWALR